MLESIAARIASTAYDAEWRSRMKAGDPVDLPPASQPPRNRGRLWDLIDVRESEVVPHIVVSRRPLIAVIVRKLKRLAADGSAVVQGMRPGVVRTKAEAVVEPPFPTNLQGVVSGTAAGILRSNHSEPRINSPCGTRDVGITFHTVAWKQVHGTIAEIACLEQVGRP